MSKLYLRANSNSRKTPIQGGASEEIDAYFIVGSAHEPKCILRVTLHYDKGHRRFSVQVHDGEARTVYRNEIEDHTVKSPQER